MSLPKYKDLNSLTTLAEIEQEIFLLQKNIFDLKLKKSTNQKIKPHLFVHTKRRIAQLKYKKSISVNYKEI
jgi:ribosomal protein L29